MVDCCVQQTLLHVLILLSLHSTSIVLSVNDQKCPTHRLMLVCGIKNDRRYCWMAVEGRGGIKPHTCGRNVRDLDIHAVRLLFLFGRWILLRFHARSVDGSRSSIEGLLIGLAYSLQV